MIESWNAAWRLWILVKFDIAPGEVARVLRAQRIQIRSWCGVWDCVLSVGWMRNLCSHRHHEGSGQNQSEDQRGRDPAPADSFLSELGCLHDSSQRTAIPMCPRLSPIRGGADDAR